jgi:hypothetical protein
VLIVDSPTSDPDGHVVARHDALRVQQA